MRTRLAWRGPHTRPSAGGEEWGAPDWQPHQDYTQKGRINSQKGNPDVEPKEGRVDSGWPQTTSVHDRNSWQIRWPSWLDNYHFISSSQGFLTPLKDYWMKYNTRVLLFTLCSRFWGCLQMGLLVHVWCVTVWVPFVPKHYAGITQVDQCALTQEHGRGAGALWCPHNPPVPVSGGPQEDMKVAGNDSVPSPWFLGSWSFI